MLPSETYFTNHTLQFRDVEKLLKKYSRFVKWSHAQKIIDIGCGPGDVTHDLLLPLISINAELHGIDISKSMIDLANSQYINSRLNFDAMDLVGRKIVQKYHSYFDLVFSFYCLHWIPNQRRAIKNIHSIMKPSGQILLILVVDCAVYSIYEQSAASPKWGKYMKNYKDSISPYRRSANAVSDFGNLMRDIGFHIEQCFCSSKSYRFPSKKVFHEWIKGVHALRKNIPEHLLEEYDAECERICWNQNLYTWHESTNEVTFNYTVLTCFADKL